MFLYVFPFFYSVFYFILAKCEKDCDDNKGGGGGSGGGGSDNGGGGGGGIGGAKPSGCPYCKKLGHGLTNPLGSLSGLLSGLLGWFVFIFNCSIVYTLFNYWYSVITVNNYLYKNKDIVAYK